jgi:hypothetical protein
MQLDATGYETPNGHLYRKQWWSGPLGRPMHRCSAPRRAGARGPRVVVRLVQVGHLACRCTINAQCGSTISSPTDGFDLMTFFLFFLFLFCPAFC